MKQTGSEKYGDLKQTQECTSSLQGRPMHQGQVVTVMGECKLSTTRYSDFQGKYKILFSNVGSKMQRKLKIPREPYTFLQNPIYENISLYHQINS